MHVHAAVRSEHAQNSRPDLTDLHVSTKQTEEKTLMINPAVPTYWLVSHKLSLMQAQDHMARLHGRLYDETQIMAGIPH